MLGTAPTEPNLILVEAPGSWGPDALAGSSLSEQQRGVLQELDSSWRVLLVRHPARRFRLPRRNVWLSTPAGTWHWDLDPGTLIDPTNRPLEAQPVTDPLLFVCTNGGRDRCCALKGRALVQRLDAATTWEISHLGGHRFAPTALRLPDRRVFGRLTGEPTTENLRGIVGWPPPVQVAVADLPATVVSATIAEAGRVEFTVATGRRYVAQVDPVEVAPRPVSCRTSPKPGIAYQRRSLQPGD